MSSCGNVLNIISLYKKINVCYKFNPRKYRKSPFADCQSSIVNWVVTLPLVHKWRDRQRPSGVFCSSWVLGKLGVTGNSHTQPAGSGVSPESRHGMAPSHWHGPQGSPECLRCGPCRYIRIGDKECEFNKNFRLILHTKLANPHYKPELQAQTTLLNFTVTEDGLEAQLLAEVVSIERPDLERLKVTSAASPPERTHPSLGTDNNARGWGAKWDCVTEESVDTYEKKYEIPP